MTKETIYAITCTHCHKPRQTIIRGKLIGTRECFYCGKKFTISVKNSKKV